LSGQHFGLEVERAASFFVASLQMTRNRYTFGDTDDASTRLRRLAELYERETRDLLERGGVQKPDVAVDLGCGPGWSTRLVQAVLNPNRTIGLDASERYIVEARRIQSSTLEFHVHDVTQAPFPVAPDAILSRFLLTHLSSVGDVLTTWAKTSAPGCRLFSHETESLETDHPTLRRYYELVGQLQRHYGQMLLVGGLLESRFEKSGWRVVESRRRALEKPACKMAQLHLSNLRTWRHDEYAIRSFDAGEIDVLEISLAELAEGTADSGVVLNAARQIIARRE
jgi:trans-aconitate 2-methyltransferase